MCRVRGVTKKLQLREICVTSANLRTLTILIHVNG